MRGRIAPLAVLAALTAVLAGCDSTPPPPPPAPSAPSPSDVCRTLTDSLTAAVRLQIAPDGTVVPGSPKTVKAVGDAQVASAVEAAALAMNFDVDAGAKPTAPVPFTTVYAACLRP